MSSNTTHKELISALARVDELCPSSSTPLAKRVLDLEAGSRKRCARLRNALNAGKYVFDDAYEHQAVVSFTQCMNEAVKIHEDIERILAAGAKGDSNIQSLGPETLSLVWEGTEALMSLTLSLEVDQVLNVVLMAQKQSKFNATLTAKSAKHRTEVARQLFLTGTRLLLDNFLNYPETRPYKAQALEIIEKQREKYSTNAKSATDLEGPNIESRLQIDALMPKAAFDYMLQRDASQHKLKEIRYNLMKNGIEFKLTREECEVRALPKEMVDIGNGE